MKQKNIGRILIGLSGVIGWLWVAILYGFGLTEPHWAVNMAAYFLAGMFSVSFMVQR